MINAWLPLWIFAAAIGGISLACFIMLEMAPNARFSVALTLLFERKSASLADLNRRQVFSLGEFATIEKYIPRIQSVVVVSHRIDEPKQALHDAVFDNFQQGARYIFFVSSFGHIETELRHYKSWFKAIYDLAKDKAPRDGPNSSIHSTTFESLLSIKTIPAEWPHVPYVFYTYVDDTGELVLFPLKGTTPSVGISSMYQRVDPGEAKAIVSLCTLAADEFDDAIGGADLPVERTLPDTKVVDLGSYRQSGIGV